MSPKNSKKDKFIKKNAAEDRVKRGVGLLGSESLIRFNFKYYIHGDGAGQSFDDWQNDKILADLNEKLHHISLSTITELKNNGTLSFYDRFPGDSVFREPVAFRDFKIQWVKLRITGRRRLIGVMLPDILGSENVFYVVFLDKNHQFYPIEND